MIKYYSSIYSYIRKKFVISKKSGPSEGFTIVEVLVTSVIFSIIAMGVSSVFVQTLGLQRRGAAAQKIQDNASFVLESMSRDIRVSATINQESPNCTATTLTITHPVKGTVIYRLNGGVIEKSEGGGSYVAISGSDVDFTRFNFCVVGSLQNDNKTPRIAILSTVQNKSGREILKVNLQTTVSSRDEIGEFSFP